MNESKKMTRTTATAETGASAPTEESFLRLLGRVRHDLRSPLGHILGFVEILLEEAAASGADGLMEGLRSILQVANEALGRVNAVLNAGPPEGRSEELMAFSVHLGEAANQIRNVAEQLAEQCDRDGRKTFSEDLHRIAGSAAELLELAAVLAGQGRDDRCQPRAGLEERVVRRAGHAGRSRGSGRSRRACRA